MNLCTAKRLQPSARMKHPGPFVGNPPWTECKLQTAGRAARAGGLVPAPICHRRRTGASVEYRWPSQVTGAHPRQARCHAATEGPGGTSRWPLVTVGTNTGDAIPLTFMWPLCFKQPFPHTVPFDLSENAVCQGGRVPFFPCSRWRN